MKDIIKNILEGENIRDIVFEMFRYRMTGEYRGKEIIITQDLTGTWDGVIRDEFGDVESATGIRKSKEDVFDWLMDHGVDPSKVKWKKFENKE